MSEHDEIIKFGLRQMEWDRAGGSFGDGNRVVDRHNREILAAYKQGLNAAEARISVLEDALREARTNVAYGYRPENCGDHCRSTCIDCVLRNTIDDLDAVLSPNAVKGAK